MKAIILLTTILFIASTARKPPCHACLNKICYRRDIVLKGTKYSGQLAIDRTSNTVFFHYQNNQFQDFTGAFEFDGFKFHVIPNIGFTFGHAVDQANRDLYCSGVQGIFNYNPIHNRTESLNGLKDKTIWHMHYTDRLFYTEFKTKGLYVYVNRKSLEIPGFSKYQIDDFVIDKNNDTYFMSDYALYLLKNGGNTAELYENEIYFLATDKNREALFVQPFTRGVYKTNYKTGKLTEFGAFSKEAPYKLVFDSDNNLIYYTANNKNLYYLYPTMNKCSVITKGTGKNRRKMVSLNKTQKKFLKHNNDNNLTATDGNLTAYRLKNNNKASLNEIIKSI